MASYRVEHGAPDEVVVPPDGVTVAVKCRKCKAVIVALVVPVAASAEAAVALPRAA